MKRVVGIDLGTTHCAVSYSDKGDIVDFPVAQLVGPGLVQARPLLPSCLYLAAEHEFTPGLLDLPWGPGGPRLCGAMARQLGAATPARFVHSAKSWLCHDRVDRAAAILPWGSPAEVGKLSPVDASAAYLRHLAAAWDHAFPGEPLAEQDLVLTLPASFDEAARKLTLDAARAAGLGAPNLVEEPQAAFHAFAHGQGRGLAAALEGVRTILVVDVGGGTTDLTLIEVSRDGDHPALKRIAVGDHLMLGGDNMDAALVRLVEPRLFPGGARPGAAVWARLLHACREAKERLLGHDAPQAFALAVAGEGSRLISSTLRCELGRSEVETCLVEGFLPACGLDAAPQRTQRSGLQELGLPFAQDPAITRHVAAFLRAHLGRGGEAVRLRPDAILLNGGVFNSPLLAARLCEVVNAWFPDQPPLRLLPAASLDLAVARGAVAHGLALRGEGVTIGGGSAHAFYVGVDSGGGRSSRQALCVASHGQEPGTSCELSSLDLEVVTDRPVRFPLYASSVDLGDQPGAVRAIDETFHALPPLATVLRGEPGSRGRERIHLRSSLSPLGTLELSCVSTTSAQAWNLEFDLRVETPASEALPPASSAEPRALPSAVTALLESVLGGHASASEPRELRNTFNRLEESLGDREGWDLPLLRALWTWLHRNSNARRRGPEQERLYYQLFGYCLRPGFGDALDPWRCETAVRMLEEGVRHPAASIVWNEYWIAWRRLAPGLPEAAQQRQWDRLEGHLARRVPPNPPRHLARPKGVQFEGVEEMVRAAASLELLDAEQKARLGGWLMERIAGSKRVSGPWAWALGRLGARVPLHAGAHKVLAPAIVEPWVEALLARKPDSVEGAAFALAQLCRRSGDLSRDLPEALRNRVAEALAASGAPPRFVELVRDVVELDQPDIARALGDALPVGLRLGRA